MVFPKTPESLLRSRHSWRVLLRSSAGCAVGCVSAFPERGKALPLEGLLGVPAQPLTGYATGGSLGLPLPRPVQVRIRVNAPSTAWHPEGSQQMAGVFNITDPTMLTSSWLRIFLGNPRVSSRGSQAYWCLRIPWRDCLTLPPEVLMQ